MKIEIPFLYIIAVLMLTLTPPCLVQAASTEQPVDLEELSLKTKPVKPQGRTQEPFQPIEEKQQKYTPEEKNDIQEAVKKAQEQRHRSSGQQGGDADD